MSHKKFYTSDLHFDHHNLYSTGFRSFSCAQECEELIRHNINSKVQKGDVLYILGDLSLDTEYDKLASYIASLNGTKIVIQGNHDSPKTLQQLKEDKIIANWHAWRGCRDSGVPVLMMHFVPLEAHVGPEMRLHLHGHVHGFLKSILTCPLRYDVGVDANNYSPVSLEDLDADLINKVRIHPEECPAKQDAMLCHACSSFVTTKRIKLSGM